MNLIKAQTIVKIIDASIDNASELATCAKLLMKSGKFATSLAMSVFALEELGKAALADGLAMGKKRPVRIQNFEVGHRSHTLKLKYAAGLPLLLLSWYAHRPTPDLKLLNTIMNMNKEWHRLRTEMYSCCSGISTLDELHTLKMSALYVSYNEKAGIISPNTMVSEECAGCALRLSSYGVKSTNKIWKLAKNDYINFVSKVRSLDDDKLLEIRSIVEKWTKKLMPGKKIMFSASS